MNKKDLIKILASKTNLKRADVTNLMDQLTETIVSTTLKGEPVTLVGFGSFSVKTRKSRVGVHPATSQKINIPTSSHLSFRASKGAIK